MSATELRLEELRESPLNPRRKISEDLKDLTASVQAQGIIQPLVVRVNGDGYEIVAGHRRFRAAGKAGLETVPAIIREMTDDEVRQVMLVENLQRVDLNPVEEARSILELVTAGMTEKELSAAIGRSVSFVSSRLKLMDLKPPLLRAVEQGLPLARVDLLIEVQEKAPELLDDDNKERLETALSSLAEGNSGYLERAKEETVRQRVMDEIIEKCTAKGVLFVIQDTWEMPKGVLLLKTKDLSPSETNVLDGVDEKSHAKEPCHGVMIRVPAYGKPVVKKACLDRSRHTKSGKSSLKRGGDTGLSDAEIARRDADRERRAEERRKAALVVQAKESAVRAAKASDGSLAEALLRFALDESNMTERKRAATVLRLEFEDDYDGPTNALVEFVEKGKRQLVQAVFAVALVTDTYGEGAFGSKALLGSVWGLFLEAVVEAVEEAGDEDAGA